MKLAALARCVLFAVTIAANLPAHAENVTIPGRIVGQTMHDTLQGELYAPTGVGPFPAVVLLHGCRGMTDGIRFWAEKLAGWGFVTLVLDSFGPRGVSEACLNPAGFPPMTRAFDAYLAADYLRALPFVSNQKVGVLGHGHGGWSALYLSDRWAEFAGVRPFDAIVALYPACEPHVMRQLDAATLILVVEKEELHSERCRFAEEYLQTISGWRYIDFVFYPDAWQGFDVPGLDMRIPAAVPAGTILLQYNQAAADDAQRRTRAWFDRFLRRKAYN